MKTGDAYATRWKPRGKLTIITIAGLLPFLLECLTLSIATMESDQERPVADDPKTVGGVFVASLPAAIAAGMFAIGALLLNMQIQSARIEATLQQMAAAVNELKNDYKVQLSDLDERVRTLEIQK